MNSSEIVERLRRERPDYKRVNGKTVTAYFPVNPDGPEAASHIEAQDKLLSAVKEAYEAYHAALKNREHGGIAAHRCVDAIGLALSQKDTP